MARKSIDELAKHGAQIRQGAQIEVTREQQRELANRAELAAISTTPLGVLRTYTGGMIVAAVTLGFVFYFVTMRAFNEPHMPPAENTLRIIAPFVGAFVAIVIVRIVALAQGRASYVRTLAWFRGLPFETRGIDRMLGNSPDKSFETRIQMTEGTDLERIASAVIGLGNKRIAARVVDDAIVVVIMVASSFDDVPAAPDTNYRGLGLFRSLVDGVLREVHATTPIVSVELKSDDA